ncbi:MAG: Bifunctional purine biosynthetic protein ade1 [Geoglossum umbratile]|nr:MAG: Bifunctional purine biosynthetic protein ade1 [Geoglossum umbratile]
MATEAPPTEQLQPPTSNLESIPPVITETELDGILPLTARGKVRDIYEVDAKTLLFVATDRISAYDVVMKNGIPNKGTLLTLLSAHWLNLLIAAHPTLKTHFLTLSLPPSIPQSLQHQFLHRSMQVRKYKIFPVEAIVRGYITGSAWKEYKSHGTVHGIPVEPGLRECDKFPGGPLYTPSTKAEQGMHDENIHPDKAISLVGPAYAPQIATLALSLYATAHDYALSKGLIIADTKFEFGVDLTTTPPSIILVDEVLTPDSSRFWPLNKYEPGRPQDSFDKQYLRDWLVGEGLGGKEGVEMPGWVAEKTGGKYREAFERLTGKTVGEFIGEAAKKGE